MRLEKTKNDKIQKTASFMKKIAFDHASSRESSEASYEGMYGSDDPDFDMNRARRSNLNELFRTEKDV